jgi:ribonuclease III family protein
MLKMVVLKESLLIGMNMKTIEMNVLTLAYLGDAIYEIYVREYLVKKGIIKVNDLQKEAVNYVSAKSQSKFLDEMIKEDFFSESEISLIKRARNHKGSSHPKNTDIITYKHATGLEALIGYLYLENDNKRLDEIMKRILGD